MKILPIRPIENLRPATTMSPRNTGIVPPYMVDSLRAGRSGYGPGTGVVPPWIVTPLANQGVDALMR
ncbi:MAG: hypothetical protein JWO69_1844 [Thermoleophilia bacterium]|jgi:hypothetical protein|nr:hypothetical protein [Thermoleophilia bacterium]